MTSVNSINRQDIPNAYGNYEVGRGPLTQPPETYQSRMENHRFKDPVPAPQPPETYQSRMEKQRFKDPVPPPQSRQGPSGYSGIRDPQYDMSGVAKTGPVPSSYDPHGIKHVDAQANTGPKGMFPPPRQFHTDGIAQPSAPFVMQANQNQYPDLAYNSTAQANPFFAQNQRQRQTGPTQLNSGYQMPSNEMTFMAELSQKNPPPHLMRPSVTRLPANNTIKSKAHLPIGFVMMHSNTEIEVPLVNMGAVKVIRCLKCRSYINCFVKFTENGNKWTCCLCGNCNEVPNEYFCSLNERGFRQDREDRYELMYGAVEFVASPDYMSRPPMAPFYLAVLDVSVAAVQSGFLECICKTLWSIIDNDELPGLERAEFGVITFDSSVHFYDIGTASATAHISVVPGAASDIFVPMPDGGLVHIKENKGSILTLLDSIPRFWQTQANQDANVSAAMTAAKLLLKHNGGKVILGLATVPTYPELGLNPTHDIKRDAKNRLVPGHVADEADGLKPSSNYFSMMATNLAHLQISVDLIAAPAMGQPMDLATVCQLASGSSGSTSYYPGFKTELFGTKLVADLRRNLSHIVGWEGVMRVRTSVGWNIDGYAGHYCFRGMDLMMLPCFTDTHTVTLSLNSNESVVSDPICFLQLALLYTTCQGERRIRVLTYALPCTQRLNELSQSIDVAAASAVICQKALDECAKGKLADGRSLIQAQFGALVSTMVISHPVVPPVANLAFPLDETNLIQQACLLCVGMLKSSVFRDGRDITADQRVNLFQRLRRLPLSFLLVYFNPTLLDVTTNIQSIGVPNDRGEIILPPKCRLSARCLNGEAGFFCCDGESIYFWVGRALRAEFLRSFFGVGSFNEINPQTSEIFLGSVNDPIGTRLMNIIATCRKTYSAEYLRIVVCKQGDPVEFKFMTMLSEDKSHTVGAAFFEIWQKFTMSHGGMAPGIQQPPMPTQYGQR